MATITLPKGMRASSERIHSCSGVAFSVTTALARCRLLRAPWISNVRRYASPRQLISPSRACPPLECWVGTRPSQAAICRPCLNSRALCRRSVPAGHLFASDFLAYLDAFAHSQLAHLKAAGSTPFVQP
jgi:hypothetical protein